MMNKFKQVVTSKVFIILLIIVIAILLSSYTYRNKLLINSLENQISELESERDNVYEINSELIDKVDSISEELVYSESEVLRLNEIIEDLPMLITSEEFDLLAKVVYCEANIEPYEGQVAVARVILNRWLGSKWKDDSIHEVIYHPGQFSQILDKIDSTNPTSQNYLAVIDAINNTINMPIEVDSFESTYSDTQNGSSYTRWKTIGGHNFNILKKG